MYRAMNPVKNAAPTSGMCGKPNEIIIPTYSKMDIRRRLDEGAVSGNVHYVFR